MQINWAHVHLIINHIPVVGVMGAILLLVYAMMRKREDVTVVSLGAFVFLALMTFPVFFAGEAAEDSVKKLPGVTETYIGRHEEMADLSIVLMESLGILALTGLVLLKRVGRIPKLIVILTLVMSLITAAAVGLTANLGGQIRHTEIRDSAGSSDTSPTGT